MSNVENGVEQKLWVPRYPFLPCAECQQRSFAQPVLPTAPYPPPSVLEEIRPYPVLPMQMATTPYYPEPTLMGTQDDRNLWPGSEKKSTNTSAPHNANAMPTAVTQEAKTTADEPIVVVSRRTAKNEETDWKSKHCSSTCWLIGPFLVILSICGFLFHQFHMQYRTMVLRERENAIHYPRYHDYR